MGLPRGLFELVLPPACLACGCKSYEPLCGDCFGMIDVIADPVCRTCGRPAAQSAEACSACRKAPPSFTRARAMAVYDFPVREAVIGLKHRSGRAVAGQLAPLMWQTLRPVIEQADILSFVPVTRARLANRGHNQARELALAVAVFSGQPVAGLLGVTGAVADMGTNKTRRRSRNVEGAFGLRNRSDALRRRISGSRVALIDDVFTSGATANECAKVLLAAGAASVDVLTLARTP